MRSGQEVRDRLADLRDELEEGSEAVEAEKRGYVEVLEEADRGRGRGPTAWSAARPEATGGTKW